MDESEPSTYKILIDVTFLFDQYGRRGIGRYGKEILRRMTKLILEDGHWKLHLIGFWDLEKSLMEMKFSKLAIEEIVPKITYHSIGKPNMSGLRNVGRWQKTYGVVIDEIGPDVFYAVHFERGLPTVPFFSKKLIEHPKTVVATHDVIPLVNNKFSQKSPIHNWIKKNFYTFLFKGVQNANLVITPSDFSKKDLHQYGSIPEDRIRRIYLGVDDMFNRETYEKEISEEQALLQRLGITNKVYFFYDSGVEPNKGIEELLLILQQLNSGEIKTDTSIPTHVVISGGDFSVGTGSAINAKSNLGRDFLKKAKKAGVLEYITTAGFITDSELVTVLIYAKAYLYLSQYEGFGFGPIQAMKAEVPAIVANRSCLPEVTGGGALTVDTGDPKKAAQDIVSFLKDKKRVETLVSNGKKIAEAYDWDNTAKKTWEEIKNLLQD